MATDALRVAAIDLGTNSFHMVIVEERPRKGIVEVDRVKDMICIGRGSISTKLLGEEAMQAGIAALKHFLVLARQHGVAPERVIAFATSAIREARNQGEFIRRVRDETGLQIRVISGKEEAEFIYYGVRNAVRLGNSPDLIFDIGGGSVEFVIADRFGVKLLESRKIGVARMFERFVTTDPVREHDIKLLEQFFASEMVSAAGKASELGVKRGIASSGTAENIARMIRSFNGEENDAPLNNTHITREDFSRLYREVLPLRSSERKRLTGLDEKRVDLIVPGLILFDIIFRIFDLGEIVISGSALREGMVLHYLQQHGDGTTHDEPDIRRESVYELGFRCNWNRSHSEQVAMLCLRLFDQLQTLHGLDGRYRELLEYAALLHNIGTFISISSHHKHSQYIIMNAELRGFTPAETLLIGNVARYHRKSPPSEKHAQYALLKPAARKAVDVLSGILRVANGLERGHRQNIISINASIGSGEISIGLRSRYEPDIEVWAAELMKSWLEEVLQKSIVFDSAFYE
ncbi:MAG: Ppx/GppA family phosphatase [Chlorobium sp.]|jgi:exopolyphosphatase/guanosine-5'-triphosphate,3'-diphosphate pyrophosphatase|uniref:Ppx/GppA phosphatase family protein n=1 Tax=Chlorobium sp. TaxID=1095 RepID=UPI001D683C58|nr:Ppx/GppA phosphatase family protein [Chlorobium sp.]MBN1279428.1 Ppx/GppA family phosphatase [Chlorobiaceae bacterium]MCF8216463.1 Ppx/GppA family phosphatase [Chlorobium sp.]MCF8271371.1 Ppx/GppA family phosphatase [Chlorobium sp.]MCF8287740.1 Ppx/GppA family phosphatase [Chlorobium sp.]MCF8291282.1 Ppx/GppA family phosphatase [Chlorobium sp.]